MVALLASLLVHGALLAVMPDWNAAREPEARFLRAFMIDPPRVSPPDFAVPPPIVEVPPPVFDPPPPPPPVVQPKPKPKPTPKQKPVAKPRPKPPPVRKPEPASVAEAKPVPPSRSEAPTPAPAPAPAPMPPQPTPAATPPPPDPRLLTRYGDTLSEHFAGAQTYPRLAAMRGWEGEVLLRLTIGPGGNLLSVRVLRSSGHEILDRHAVALVEGSGPLPRPPRGSDRQDLEITVPVRYRLRSG